MGSLLIRFFNGVCLFKLRFWKRVFFFCSFRFVFVACIKVLLLLDKDGVYHREAIFLDNPTICQVLLFLLIIIISSWWRYEKIAVTFLKDLAHLRYIESYAFCNKSCVDLIILKVYLWQLLQTAIYQVFKNNSRYLLSYQI